MCVSNTDSSSWLWLFPWVKKGGMGAKKSELEHDKHIAGKSLFIYVDNLEDLFSSLSETPPQIVNYFSRTNLI